MGQGKGLQIIHWAFSVSQYFKNILPLIDSFDVLYMNKLNILGLGAVGVRDVIRNGRQYGRHLGFY